jgi:branched-chain amino acid transport system ATP-binding protein
MALLEVLDIHTHYGAIEALKGVSLAVDAGEVVTLIGSNGAGKTTTLRSISGLTPASTGKITFAGEDITRVPAHEVVIRGIALAPEGRHCFSRMTVRENLDLGAYRRRGRQIAEDLDRVFDLFPRLRERERQKAGTMSGGEQQMLAIGRALMARPRLLLLDEPSLGIAPILVERIYETIGEINRSGVAILLVEQNASRALDAASRGYVLETGRVSLANDSASLHDDPAVQKAATERTGERRDRRQRAVFVVRVADLGGHRVVDVGA